MSPQTAPASAPSDEPASALREALRFHVLYSLGKRLEDATPKDLFLALSLAARQRIIDGMLATEQRYRERGSKRLCYLSMEFLMGRALENNLRNLGLYEDARQVLGELQTDLDAVVSVEQDAALGNGGLGRLAACFLDSLATLGMPGFGYGINYEFGLFRQEIDNGEQREKPDHWYGAESPWLMERGEEICLVPLYGRLEDGADAGGAYAPLWLDWKVLVGVPSDMPIVGHGGRTVNVLRLYSARASDEFDVAIFNQGDYIRAVQQKMASETVSKVLYPSDSVTAGRELRLVQEYFLVACSLRDILRRYQRHHDTLDAFPSEVAIQLNDTHPALAVAELMRLFVDENGLSWERAWELVQASLGYTNHTLLAEALERWPVPLVQHVLPRHLQIIYEINRRFLEQVAGRWPGDVARMARMSLIEEGEPKQVRMAHLSIIGSHSVNGVAALHTELVKKQLVPDFNELWPEKFNNKTNGITQRRWLLAANPALSELIHRTIGPGWITDLEQLRGLDVHASDAGFQEDFLRVKQENKQRLAALIRQMVGVKVDPTSIFDVQIKRIHEYKRQLLNMLHVIHLYLTLAEGGDGMQAVVHPRTVIFAGKAAPGYRMAKRIIQLINKVGEVVNADPRTRGLLRVVFLPDYRVTLAEKIIPAADLSEQISTAGKEASGTGNMKLALSGALTIGTLDGANIEILEEVGGDNFYLFGLTAEEVETMRQRRSYDPWEYYRRYADLHAVLETLAGDRFCRAEPGLFRPLFERLLHEGDEYFHLADFHSYLGAQRRAAEEFRDRRRWARKAIHNVARLGRFSSDRTVREYARDIWNIEPVL